MVSGKSWANRSRADFFVPQFRFSEHAGQFFPVYPRLKEFRIPRRIRKKNLMMSASTPLCLF
jgi:hypothetical protein